MTWYELLGYAILGLLLVGAMVSGGSTAVEGVVFSAWAVLLMLGGMACVIIGAVVRGDLSVSFWLYIGVFPVLAGTWIVMWLERRSGRQERQEQREPRRPE